MYYQVFHVCVSWLLSLLYLIFTVCVNELEYFNEFSISTEQNQKKKSREEKRREAHLKYKTCTLSPWLGKVEKEGCRRVDMHRHHASAMNIWYNCLFAGIYRATWERCWFLWYQDCADSSATNSFLQTKISNNSSSFLVFYFLFFFFFFNCRVNCCVHF